MRDISKKKEGEWIFKGNLKIKRKRNCVKRKFFFSFLPHICIVCGKSTCDLIVIYFMCVYVMREKGKNFFSFPFVWFLTMPQNL